MCPLMTDFSNVASASPTSLKRALLKRTASLAALLFGLVLASPAFGDDSKSSGSPAGADNSANSQAAGSDQYDGEQAHGPLAKDSPRHRAALGVLLSESGNAVSVIEVVPRSPADRAGVNVGDEIRFVNNQPVRTAGELIAAIGASTPGTEVDLMIRRNGRRQILRAVLAARVTVFRSSDRSLKNDSGRSGNLVTHSGRQADRSGSPSSYSYRSYSSVPNGVPAREGGAAEGERLRALEQRLYYLQREIDTLRVPQRVAPVQTFDAQGWWERQHHGEGHNDPALFQ